MANKYSVSFRIETNENWATTDDLERELFDIISVAVAPSFNFDISRLSFTVKKARN